MFRPPICPYRSCPEHVAPRPRFYIRSGYYHPDCRSHPVQRYRCKSCGRTFSRQTFRADFRDHRPHLNHRLVELVASGVGIRQSARILRLSPRCTELKLRKIGRHLRRLNANLHGPLPEGSRFHFDELETYEGQRNTRPLTVPVLIESMTRFIVWAESATIRPRGRMTEKRIGQIAQSEALHGPRRDNSRTACLRVLRRGAAMCGELPLVRIDTDEKQTYPGLIAGAFGDRPVEHETTSSKVARDAKNPLFPINHEEAIMRDLMGRLRRESWLVSKKRRYLDIALHVHIAYRNFVRKRFNRDRATPAQMLGLVPRRLSVHQLLSWSQAFGRRSVHPLSSRGMTVEDALTCSSAAA